MRPLIISPNAWRSLVGHAEDSYPFEACGAVLGYADFEKQSGELAVGMTNTSHDPRQNYELDPEEMEDVERRARSLGMRVLAFYHSHPDAPPDLSVDDLRLGCPFRLNLIVSVWGGEVRTAACYKLAPSRIAAKAQPMEVVSW